MIGSAGASSLVSPSKNFKFEGDSATIALSGTAVCLASVFGNGINYASGRFLACMLDDKDFSLYALVLTIFIIVSVMVFFAIGNGTIKFVFHNLAEGQYGKTRETAIASASMAFVSGLVAVIGLALLSHPIAVTLDNKPDLLQSLLLLSSAIPSESTYY